MKVVVLAAGKGLRMGKLTEKTPKPFLKVGGNPLIEYVLGSLPDEIDDVIIVVDYLGDKIKDFVNKGKMNKKVRFVQGSDRGNVFSFLATKKYLKDERFLLIYGDEIPSPSDVKKCLEKDLSILTFDGGVYDGVMVLDTGIFDYRLRDNSFRTLLGDFVEDHDVSFIEAKNFVGGINTPADLARVERIYG